MSGYDAIIVAVIFLFLTGFLTPLIPIFVILGRLTTRTQALERSTSPEYVITYNQEMGRLHRVWISTHRPITTHLRGIAEGTLIWKPFATLETVQEVFGNSVVAVAAGHRYDMRMEDGRTFFDHFLEDKQSRESVAPRADKPAS